MELAWQKLDAVDEIVPLKGSCDCSQPVRRGNHDFQLIHVDYHRICGGRQRGYFNIKLRVSGQCHSISYLEPDSSVYHFSSVSFIDSSFNKLYGQAEVIEVVKLFGESNVDPTISGDGN